MKQKHRYRRRTKGGGLIAAWPATSSPEDIAARVHYRGSSEHKRRPVHESYDVSPELRSDASPCPPHVCREDAQRALEEAIRSQCVSTDWVGEFPKYVWTRLEGAPYVARVTNHEQGEYKGWPIEEVELPSDRDGRLRSGSSDG